MHRATPGGAHRPGHQPAPGNRRHHRHTPGPHTGRRATGRPSGEGEAPGALAARAAGAEFGKTATGYAKLGDQLGDVTLLRKLLPPGIRIKVSGGIRTYAGARALLDAGADRLGSSHGVQRIEDLAAGLRAYRHDLL